MAYSEQTQERQRFRSFAERFLIARAQFFAAGREEEDAWECMLKARAIYQRLNAYSSAMEEPPEEGRSPVAQRMNAVVSQVKAGTITPQQGRAILASLQAQMTP